MYLIFSRQIKQSQDNCSTKRRLQTITKKRVHHKTGIIKPGFVLMAMNLYLRKAGHFGLCPPGTWQVRSPRTACLQARQSRLYAATGEIITLASYIGVVGRVVADLEIFFGVVRAMICVFKGKRSVRCISRVRCNNHYNILKPLQGTQ